MNWNEKAMAQADVVYEDWTTRPRYAERRIYREAARWQREQLRTPEAIEKAADILSFQTTGGCYPKADEQCRHVMRQVLTALLGDN